MQSVSARIWTHVAVSISYDGIYVCMCKYMWACVRAYVCVINKCMLVCEQVVGLSEWTFFQYLLNDLDFIFQSYLILEVYVSFRRSYLNRILIYTGFLV